MKSGLFSLKVKDFIQSFIMSIGTPVLYFLQELIPTWNIPVIAKIAIAAAVTYLLKNFFKDDTAVAKKTIEKAGGAVVENLKKSE